MALKQLIDAAGWTLLHSLWQFAAIALLFGIVMRVVAPGRCQVRYVLACAAIVLMIAALTGTFAWQNSALLAAKTAHKLAGDSAAQLDVPVIGIQSVDRVAPQNTDGGALAATAPVENEFNVFSPSVRSSIEAAITPWIGHLVALWVLGVSLLSLRLCVNWLAVRRLRTSGSAITESNWTRTLARVQRQLAVSRPVALLESSAAAVPMVIGWLRPVVLVLVGMVTGLTSGEIEAILAHELAHIRRHDYLVNLVQNVAETLLFYHPAVWWVSRQIRNEREFCCDEIAARLCDGTAAYARALTAVETMRSVPPMLGVAASGGSLLERIRRLAGREPQPAGGASVVMATMFVLGIAFALLIGDTGQSEPPKKPMAVENKAPAPEGFRYMTVRTVDDAGKPVANTRVFVNVWPDEDRKYKSTKENYFTDADGKVDVLVPDPPRLFRVWTQQDGYVPLFAQWWPEQQPDGDQIPDEFTFVLPTGTKIGGTIVDDAGKPIEGVTVEVMLVNAEVKLVNKGRDDPAMSKRPVPSPWLAEVPGPGNNPCITDAQGHWSLNNVPAGDDSNVRVKLTHPDYTNDVEWGGLQAEQRVTMASFRDATAKIVMHSGIRARGTVTADGKPIADCVIVWGDEPYMQEGSQEVRTNADGTYELPPLVPGVYPLTVVAEGWRPELSIIEIEDELPPANFELKKGNVLRIKFVDENGESIPEVYVGLRGWRGKQSLYNHKHPNVLDTKIPLQADKDGVYEWSWAPPDEVRYSFEKKGYQDTESILIADGEEHVVELVAE